MAAGTGRNVSREHFVPSDRRRLVMLAAHRQTELARSKIEIEGRRVVVVQLGGLRWPAAVYYRAAVLRAGA